MTTSSMVPPHLIGSVWGKCEKILDRLEPSSDGRFELSDILHMLLSGQQHMWIVWDQDLEEIPIIGVVITELMQYPRKLMISVQYLAGERLDEWFEETEIMIANWGKASGCDGMEMSGRRGWARRLKKESWTEKYVIMNKDFEDFEGKESEFQKPDLQIVSDLKVAEG